MIAPLERVTGMELIPHACVLCANNPVDETSGEQQDCIFAPGVDVNWGDSVYICKSCAEIIADLMDRVTTEGYDRLNEKYEALVTEHAELQAEHDHAEAQLDRIRDGAASAKQVKVGAA
jgi:hypothetical protein